MAGVKISALPASPGLDGTELVPIVDAGVTRKTTVALIAAQVDLSAYEGETISLTATDEAGAVSLTAVGGVVLEATGDGGAVALQTAGAGSTIDITNDGDDGAVNISATGTDGLVNVTADSVITLESTNASVVLGAGSGQVQLLAGTVFVSGSESVIVGANDTDGAVNISASGTGGTVGVSADSRVSLAAGGDFVISVEFDVVPKLSFFDENAVAQQTGVAVTVEAIHAALVAYGLITV